MRDETVYQAHGYENRKHYLQCVAEERGVDFEDVAMIASLYGPTEDFDGLISTLEDVYGV